MERSLTPLERTFGIEEARIIYEGHRRKENPVRPIALGLIALLTYCSWMYRAEINNTVSGIYERPSATYNLEYPR